MTKETAPSKKSRVFLLDIESNRLTLDGGHILCVCVAEFREPWLSVSRSNVKVFDIRKTKAWKEGKFWEDRELVTEVYKYLQSADIIVTWYGKRFDVPALQTRFARAGLPPLENWGGRHIDLYYTARREFALHSNRLASAMQFFKCPWEKTDLSPEQWERAACGSDKDMTYVVDHCINDVLGLGWVYEQMRAYVRQHPVRADREACRVCGSHKIQFRGYSVRSNPRELPRRRVQCQSCGAWDQRVMTKEEKKSVSEEE